MADIYLMPSFEFLLEPAPFKGLWGGRGSAKSWQITDWLLGDSFTTRERIGCFREIQSSMKESVHALLKARIADHGMGDYFRVTDETIRNVITDSDFFFKGLRSNLMEIKSTHGIKKAWVEEAENVGQKSWEVLFPTVRGDDCEIIASWNPETENNGTDKLWRKYPPPGSVVKQVSWRDNEFFPKNLELQRAHCLATDPALYQHIWEGGYRKISEAVIFKNRVEVHDFDTLPGAHFLFGADWGFSVDPSVLLRMYITTNEDGSEELWVDYEAYGQPELDEIPAFFDRIPESRRWPIRADNARPETISYVSRQGFHISPAKKWAGSVEDGITHLKGFKAIHVHATRCPKLSEEMRLYSYKTDKSGNILPIPLQGNDHGPDAMRYGLDDYISDRGGLEIWKKLF